MAAAETTAETPHDQVMRNRILDAAMECFSQLGITKTSIQDIARVAGVSRGTVYRYFSDRDSLIDAGIEFGAQQYYVDAAKAMDRHDHLNEQVAAFAEVVARTQLAHRTRDRLMDGDTTLMRLFVSDRERTLRRHTEFIRTYVAAAVERGELDSRLNVDEASEWLARVIMSLTIMQSSINFDLAKPPSVGEFVRKYAVGGLGSPE